MRVQLTKEFALKLYCRIRQAERSIDFAIGSSQQWDLLRDYYTEVKRRELFEIAQWLKSVLPATQPIPPRDYFGKIRLAYVLLLPLSVLMNRVRRRWRFAGDELLFLAASVDSVLTALSWESVPPPAFLIALRMDLFMCEHIIEKRLAGVPELKKAGNIEHFCQPCHIRHWRLEELHL